MSALGLKRLDRAAVEAENVGRIGNRGLRRVEREIGLVAVERRRQGAGRLQLPIGVGRGGDGRIEESFLRLDGFLGRLEPGFRRLEIVIIDERGFDQPVEGFGMKKLPPFAGNVHVGDEALRRPARRSGARGRAKPFRGIAADGRRGRGDEVGADGAAGERQRGQSDQRAFRRQSTDRRHALGSGPSLGGSSPANSSGGRAGGSIGRRLRMNSSLLRNTLRIAGATTRSRIGPMVMPPTTTVARGFWTWLPMPVEIAAGNRPMPEA
jgi:hypothetical protein